MRKIIKLSEGWSFTDQNKNRTAVSLPHTWNALDGQDGGNDYWRGTNVYDVEFAAPDFNKDTEVVYLQFHGVNASSKVILNGKEVCSHDGGYSTFRTDVTDCLADSNKMVVEVDNSVNDRVYPQKADFTFYGGIYRDVELLVVNKAHFDLDYHGGPGIAVTPEVKGKDAEIRVETWAKVEEGKDAKVEITICDAEGNVVVTGTEAVKNASATAVLGIENVHLWDGLEDPYLYTVKAVLFMDEEAVDEITTNCGVRYFEFSPKDGFHLNGRPYPLHGVSRHQDYKGIGNAISRAEHERDMELIKELGANTIRLAHYQHDQYFYDLCDKNGMIVWAEIPYISEHL